MCLESRPGCKVSFLLLSSGPSRAPGVFLWSPLLPLSFYTLPGSQPYPGVLCLRDSPISDQCLPSLSQHASFALDLQSTIVTMGHQQNNELLSYPSLHNRCTSMLEELLPTKSRVKEWLEQKTLPATRGVWNLLFICTVREGMDEKTVLKVKNY